MEFEFIKDAKSRRQERKKPIPIVISKKELEKTDKKSEYEVVEIEILPEKIICPDCGGVTLEGLDFCDKCGGELNQL